MQGVVEGNGEEKNVRNVSSGTQLAARGLRLGLLLHRGKEPWKLERGDVGLGWVSVLLTGSGALEPLSPAAFL